MIAAYLGHASGPFNIELISVSLAVALAACNSHSAPEPAPHDEVIDDVDASLGSVESPLPEPTAEIVALRPTHSANGLEVIDPTGALDRGTLQVDDVANDILAALPDGVVGSWSLRPSGALSAAVYVRVKLLEELPVDVPVPWWTYDEARQAWFVQSIASVGAEGKSLIAAVKHFSPHAVVPASVRGTPGYHDNVSGTCTDFVRKAGEGVKDAKGVQHRGDCGYTAFTALYSGLTGPEYVDALREGRLELPFSIEYFEGNPMKDAGRSCARLHGLKLDLSAQVDVSVLDWTDRKPKTPDCDAEWKRLRSVITTHEAKHERDAAPVIAAAQNRARALNVIVCENDRERLDDDLAVAIRTKLSELDALMIEDWNERVRKLDGTTTDRCELDCSKCDQSCEQAGCPAGQICCGNECIAQCSMCQRCDPATGACVEDPAQCKQSSKVYCACNRKCYDTATSCQGECQATLGCFSGICGPATAEQCPN